MRKKPVVNSFVNFYLTEIQKISISHPEHEKKTVHVPKRIKYSIADDKSGLR